MTEIEKTLKILKARWPEVVLIISLALLRPLTIKLSNYFFVKLPMMIRPLQHWLTTVVNLLISIILILLYYGFMRTVYIEGNKRQSVAALLQTGKHFFWRMFVLGCLYTASFIILTLITRHFRCQTAVWFPLLFIIGPKLILIKFVLLIPALIIVLDCGIFESFRFLRYCKLSNAKVLIALFLATIALDLFWIIISKLSTVLPALHFILTLAQSVASKFIWLMIGVTAVRFVASLNLVYDNQQLNSGFQEPRQ